MTHLCEGNFRKIAKFESCQMPENQTVCWKKRARNAQIRRRERGTKGGQNGLSYVEDCCFLGGF